MPTSYRIVARAPAVAPQPSYAEDQLDEALAALAQARKSAPAGYVVELVAIDQDDERIVTTPLVVTAAEADAVTPTAIAPTPPDGLADSPIRR